MPPSKYWNVRDGADTGVGGVAGIGADENVAMKPGIGVVAGTGAGTGAVDGPGRKASPIRSPACSPGRCGSPQANGRGRSGRVSPVPALPEPEPEPKTPTMYVSPIPKSKSEGFVKTPGPVWTQMAGRGSQMEGRGATNCTCLPMLQVLLNEATRQDLPPSVVR